MPDLRRWYPPVILALTLVLVIVALVIAWLTYDRAAAADRLGADYTLYLGAVRRWIEGGGLYPVHQLLGPYDIADGDILYPPTVALLFAAFSVLPAALFWLIPLGALIAAVVYHRPRSSTWPLMALCLAYPITTLKVVHGNPVMWMAAALALGTIVRWPASFVVLKPTLAPFALIGVRDRRWWVALTAIAGVSLPFGTLWVDYFHVLVNARSPRGVWYSLDEVPFMLIPVIAWIGSSVNGPVLRRPLLRRVGR